MKPGLLTILFTFILLAPEVLAFHGGWQLETEKNGIKIYTREVKGSRLKQVKAVTSVTASFETVVFVLTDYANYVKWVNNITESRVIQEQSEAVHFVYTFEDAPWPVQNRYNVSKMTLNRNHDNCTLYFEAVPDFLEKRSDAIEVERYEGWWKVSSQPEGGCTIEYIIDENPGGYIPTWLINYMAVEAPMKTMENLKTTVEQLSRS